MTNHRDIDCTDRVKIGAFATIFIGTYTLVGTAATILPGSRLPERSVLGAGALLNKAYAEPGWLYAGVPARPVKALPADAAYFRRSEGFVV